MNRVILYGNVGGDPVSKQINGKAVTKFSLATSKSYTNDAGEKITGTSWHFIVLWGKVAETASKYVKKGSSLIVEGEINYRSYENKEGQMIHVTEIIGHNINLTGPKTEEKQEQKSGKVMVNSISDINDLPQHIQDAENNPDDLPYKSGNISNAFKELRDATSGAWNKFENNEDIDQFIDRD
jgi:single-strand DNA-binding protein